MPHFYCKEIKMSKSENEEFGSDSGSINLAEASSTPEEYHQIGLEFRDALEKHLNYKYDETENKYSAPDHAYQLIYDNERIIECLYQDDQNDILEMGYVNVQSDLELLRQEIAQMTNAEKDEDDQVLQLSDSSISFQLPEDQDSTPVNQKTNEKHQKLKEFIHLLADVTNTHGYVGSDVIAARIQAIETILKNGIPNQLETQEFVKGNNVSDVLNALGTYKATGNKGALSVFIDVDSSQKTANKDVIDASLKRVLKSLNLKKHLIDGLNSYAMIFGKKQQRGKDLVESSKDENGEDVDIGDEDFAFADIPRTLHPLGHSYIEAIIKSNNIEDPSLLTPAVRILLPKLVANDPEVSGNRVTFAGSGHDILAPFVEGYERDLDALQAINISLHSEGWEDTQWNTLKQRLEGNQDEKEWFFEYAKEHMVYDSGNIMSRLIIQKKKMDEEVFFIGDADGQDYETAMAKLAHVTDYQKVEDEIFAYDTQDDSSRIVVADLYTSEEKIKYDPLMMYVNREAFATKKLTEYDVECYGEYVFLERYPQAKAFVDYAVVNTADGANDLSEKIAQTVKKGKCGLFHCLVAGEWKLIVLTPKQEIICFDASSKEVKSNLPASIVSDIRRGLGRDPQIQYRDIDTLQVEEGINSCMLMAKIISDICSAQHRHDPLEMWKMIALQKVIDFELPLTGEMSAADKKVFDRIFHNVVVAGISDPKDLEEIIAAYANLKNGIDVGEALSLLQNKFLKKYKAVSTNHFVFDDKYINKLLDSSEVDPQEHREDIVFAQFKKKYLESLDMSNNLEDKSEFESQRVLPDPKTFLQIGAVVDFRENELFNLLKDEASGYTYNNITQTFIKNGDVQGDRYEFFTRTKDDHKLLCKYNGDILRVEEIDDHISKVQNELRDSIEIWEEKIANLKEALRKHGSGYEEKEDGVLFEHEKTGTKYEFIIEGDKNLTSVAKTKKDKETGYFDYGKSSWRDVHEEVKNILGSMIISIDASRQSEDFVPAASKLNGDLPSKRDNIMPIGRGKEKDLVYLDQLIVEDEQVERIKHAREGSEFQFSNGKKLTVDGEAWFVDDNCVAADASKYRRDMMAYYWSDKNSAELDEAKKQYRKTREASDKIIGKETSDQIDQIDIEDIEAYRSPAENEASRQGRKDTRPKSENEIRQTNIDRAHKIPKASIQLAKFIELVNTRSHPNNRSQ